MMAFSNANHLSISNQIAAILLKAVIKGVELPKAKNVGAATVTGLRPAEPTIAYSLLSNQQREPGKKSSPGEAAESEQLPPAGANMQRRAKNLGTHA